MRPAGPPARPTPTAPPQGPAAYPTGPAAYPTGPAGYGTPGYGTPGHGTPGHGTPGYGLYPTPFYGGPAGPSAQQKTNGLAIASLILSCAGLFFLPALAGIVFGFIARSQIARSNGLQKGNGLALAGILVGFGWLALVVLAIALGGGSSSTTGNSGMVSPGILLGVGFVGPFII
jgi:hypothetical protein